MYLTSEDYKSKIYEASTKHLLKIYINNEEINSKLILDCKPSQDLFSNDEFTLGAVTSKGLELKLHKTAVPDMIYKIYVESGIAGEVVPIGFFNIEEITKEDDHTINLKLLDNMIKFEFNYDGSKLIKENGSAEIIEVLEDICSKAGVELRFYFFFEYAQRNSRI